MGLKGKEQACLHKRNSDTTRGKEDEDFSERDAWDMANSMLCSWLLNVIDPKLRMTIAYCDTASSMWANLKKRYGMANAPKIHQLKASIATCKQGERNCSNLSREWAA